MNETVIKLEYLKVSQSIRLRKNEYNMIGGTKTPFVKIFLYPQTGLISLVDKDTGLITITSVANMIFSESFKEEREEIKEADEHKFTSKRVKKENETDPRGESNRLDFPKTNKGNKRPKKV
jgi:hypothetical protein